MPRIFDNIVSPLLPALGETLKISERADFCVGYFNLRGWKLIDHLIDEWSGLDGNSVRLLVGMQELPHDDLRHTLSLTPDEGIDQQTVLRLKKRMAEQFREQLTLGAPTNQDEAALRLMNLTSSSTTIFNTGWDRARRMTNERASAWHPDRP